MGFMGIQNWVQSDGAADFQYRLEGNIATIFRQEMKDEANCYNTPGWVNILLILKSYPSLIHFMDDKTKKQISARITKDTNENGYLWHKGGKALVRNFEKLLKEKE